MRVVTGTLEQFAFMFVETEDSKRLADFPGDYLHAVITFSGPRQGSVALTAPETLCREMAANVLGVDADDAGSDIAEDSLKELVNIICGELTPALYGDKNVFELTVPSLYRIDRSKWQELAADRENIRLWIDDKPILASLLLVNEPAR
jgi:CheY-specific phosphatase CheX